MLTSAGYILYTNDQAYKEFTHIIQVVFSQSNGVGQVENIENTIRILTDLFALNRAIFSHISWCCCCGHFFLVPIVIAITILGIVSVIISLLGCCGACCNMKILLWIYEILVGILALALLVIISVYFIHKKSITNTAITVLNTGVTNYQSMTSHKLDSLFVAIISIKLNCCGVDGGEDFAKSTNFWRNDTYAGKQYTDIKYPLICCKWNRSQPITNFRCPKSFTDRNSNINRGCMDPLKNVIFQYLDISAYALIGVFVLLFFIFLFTVTIMRSGGAMETISN
ncbi:hypothetical protein MN116_008650 [Schistosoma mekongi]|uniref:Tetraspanin n=1 Tax=Schistosoma mekongi TaxID=38744 RepID=A0AAE1Z500_SCHME|nr:hypothetical protein MN116_008650 [Schistosoma mekongi]